MTNSSNNINNNNINNNNINQITQLLLLFI
jgi:hypothetical protein